MEVSSTNSCNSDALQPIVNGMADSPSKLNTSPGMGFRHALPQIAGMMRNTKIAQSKASAKRDQSEGVNLVNLETAPEATVLVEDTGKVVTLHKDLKTEINVQDLSSSGNRADNSIEQKKDKPRPPPKKRNRTNFIESGSKPGLNNSADEKPDKEGTPRTPKRRTPKISDPKHYKNIFEENPIVVGKRNRKPKVYNDEDEEETSPKTTPRRQRLKVQETTKPVMPPQSDESEKVPLPPISKPNPPISMNPADLEENNPTKFAIGDCMWGKVTGHPWWPCIIANDPEIGIFTKIHSKNRMYHVQYFGNEGEHGWVTTTSLLPYEGKQKYEAYAKAKIASARKAEKIRFEKLFKTYPGRLPAWNVAIKEADEALKLSQQERINTYIYTYLEILPEEKEQKDSVTGTTDVAVTHKTSPQEKKKRKRSQVPETPQVDGTVKEQPKTKKRKVDSSPLKSPRGRPSHNDGSFGVYCQKHREKVLEEHPEFDDSMLENFLKQLWCRMSQKQKLRYRTKFSAEQESDSTEDGGKTKPKDKLGNDSDDPEDDMGENPTSERRKRKFDSEDKEKVKNAEGYGAADNNDVSENEGVEVDVLKLGKIGKYKKLAPSVSNTDTESNCDSQDECRPVVAKEFDDEFELSILKLSNGWARNKENVCQICYKEGDLMQCKGQCHGYFHQKCLDKPVSDSETFVCEDCTSGIHTCFQCKKREGEVKKCSVSNCGKFYHEDCVKPRPKTDSCKGFTCPLHYCETCACSSNSKLQSSKARFVRCVKCPTAYHASQFCVAAGAEVLPGYYIICPKHFQPQKHLHYHNHINVAWCFSCSLGGSLLCCEQCPAAFHAECLNIPFPEGEWYCADCSAGRRPLYGDIVWVKLGNYRWWPGEICYPDHVPLNIQDKPHQVGEFPVHFFGSNDYFWVNIGRVFLFQEGDKGSKDNSSVKSLAKVFAKGVKVATEAFKEVQRVRETRLKSEIVKQDKKPAAYKFVKTNVPIGSVQIYKNDITEVPKCECSTEQDHPCSNDTECLNLMLMYECHPNTCPAKEKCENQRFQKRQYPESVPFRTEGRGWGLKVLEDVKKGQFVNEYVGDLIDEAEVKRRLASSHDADITNFYMLTLDKNRIIDAGPKGNLSRFMNHSCDPNCETQKWMVNGDVRVGLFAVKDVPSGSELTFNYNFDCLGNDKKVCSCGSDNCSGFLGVRPKTAAAVAVERRMKEKDKNGKKKKRRRPKLDPKKEHEDDCFRCGEGGELVMCDKPGCPKVYHLQCLKLDKPPFGSWYCPWHHCDVCGKPAVKMCQDCPNSFCSNHLEGNLLEVDGVLYCTEHEDLETLSCSSSVTSSEAEEDMKVNGMSTDNGVSVEKLNGAGAKPGNKQSKGKAEKLPQKQKAITNLDRKKSLSRKDKKAREALGQRDTPASTVTKLGTATGKKDPLAVDPMFDDSDDDRFEGLVIDIPTNII